MADPKQLRKFDTRQAATYLGVRPETVKRAFRKGELRGTKLRLLVGAPLEFDQNDLDEFRAGRTQTNR